MKSDKAVKKTDYSRIKNKFNTYMLAAVMLAVTFVVFLRFFIQRQGFFGDFIVMLLRFFFRVSLEDALTIYQYTIRNNMGIIIAVAIAVCFLILCRIIISNFVRYFDEVNSGIDILIEDEDSEIELSGEMAFMQQKLNTLKQTLEKRRQDAKMAEQGKNDMVMYLAHDLKTPLSSVIGYLNLLEEAGDMTAEQRAKYVNITLEKAYRLEHLIDEFFEITRYNLNAIVLSKKNLDLYYMLVQMIDEFYPLLSSEKKQAVLHADEDTTLNGDPDKLARVFNNILKNAIAYSPPGSTIDIEVNTSGDAICIVFKNQGIIPEDRLTSIFDKFYRLDDARSSYSGGAGLGLAIAKEIVNLHGGQIHASCDGTHTSFTVKLPSVAVNP